MMRVIGLISGTSVDGIDTALVDITGSEWDLKVELVAGATYPYSDALREKILAVCAGATLSVAELAQLDDAIADEFAHAAITIQTGQAPATLVGSHGQTIFHRPPQKQELGYSWQLGRGSVIAYLTGIDTVSNFRAADISASGQGAPLVAKMDVCLLTHPTCDRCIQILVELVMLPIYQQ